MAKRSPGDDEGLQRAIQALRADQPQQAEKLCRDYLNLHPASVDHIRLLSHALIKQGRGGRAFALCH